MNQSPKVQRLAQLRDRMNQSARMQAPLRFQGETPELEAASGHATPVPAATVIQRQVLSNVETADGGSSDPYRFYVIDVVIGGRSPSPFSNTMGAHSTAWVAHIDAVRRTLIRRDIRDALDALIKLADEDLERSDLSALVGNLQDETHKLKLGLAKSGLQEQINAADLVLSDLSSAFNSNQALSNQQKYESVTTVRKLIDKYLTYVNYLPGATVRGGDPSGHGEGSARGNLNMFEYLYAAQQSGALDLPEKVSALGSKGFEGQVKECTELKFKTGDALNALKLSLIDELWTMFAVETPGIFAALHTTDNAATWMLLLKNFLKTAAMAYPYTYTITEMDNPDRQVFGLYKAFEAAKMTPPLDLSVFKKTLTEIGKTPVKATPRPDLSEVAESDLKRGGTGFKATILLADDGTVGSVEMIGRTQSPFKGTMGAHTTAWIAHLDALRNLLANKTVANAIIALKGKCTKLIDDSTLAIFEHVDEQQQEFIVQGVTNTKIANTEADTFAQNTVPVHEQVAFLEAYIFQYLSLLNFLPLSTIQTAAVPGGRSEGQHRQFLQTFEENPVDAPAPPLQELLIQHLRGLFDPTALRSFPPSKLMREELRFHGPDDEQERSRKTYEEIKLLRIGRKYDKEQATHLVRARFIDTILEAYPRSCNAVKSHPVVAGNIHDLIT
jgi:hypothetical protein